MKKSLLYYWIYCLFPGVFLLNIVQAQNYQWAKSIGGTAYDDRGYSIAVDNTGNVYITGSFSSTVDFDPGTDTANLTSIGSIDIFFAKYDAAGNYQWAKSIESAGLDEGLSIAVDGAGNVYVTGVFRGTADFDPEAGTANLTSAGEGDVFFAKYDLTGNYLWAKSIGGLLNDVALIIAVDGTGNVYVTGWFEGTADFDPGAGTVSFTSAGFMDIFFAKYDTAGNYLWAKSIGSTGGDMGVSIAVDDAGNVYVTGWFEGTVDFNPGAGTSNLTTVGNTDIFFAKYNTAGNYLWAKNIGSTLEDRAWSIAVDGTGNVYVTGFFRGTADFDPGTDTANLTSIGSWEIFFAKYDTAGNYMWAKSIESAGLDEGYSIAVDGAGNVYVTGRFSVTADFDPGADTANLTSIGSYDIFFAKYDTAGNYLWAKSIGSTLVDHGYSIAVDDTGNTYITGWFSGTADFDPGSDTANLSAAGWVDVFFAKYVNCGLNVNISKQDVTCNGSNNGIAKAIAGSGLLPYSYLWSDGSTSDSIDGLTAGTYIVTVTDSFGCTVTDSIIIAEPDSIFIASIVNAATQSNNDGAIDLAVTGGTPPYTFSWNNGAASEDIDSLFAGIYQVVVTDSLGCIDSITIEVPGATGITETNLHDQIKIYPNPFVTETTIILPSSYKDWMREMVLSLYDILGRKQKILYTVNSENNKIKIKVQRGNLLSGIYFYTILTNENVISKDKLIIKALF